jgi:hypothetical protein
MTFFIDTPATLSFAVWIGPKESAQILLKEQQLAIDRLA